MTRVIDALREKFPGRWSWNQDLSRWEHEEGWWVERRAAFAPRFDGDDDSFETRYYTSTGENLVGLPGTELDLGVEASCDF